MLNVENSITLDEIIANTAKIKPTKLKRTKRQKAKSEETFTIIGIGTVNKVIFDSTKGWGIKEKLVTGKTFSDTSNAERFTYDFNSFKEAKNCLISKVKG